MNKKRKIIGNMAVPIQYFKQKNTSLVEIKKKYYVYIVDLENIREIK